MDYQQILYHIDDGILTITLNRPERLNAFTTVMCNELIDALDHADTDDAVRAIIITGAGRAFCAGADLSKGGKTFDYVSRNENTAAHRDGGGRLTLRLFDCHKPVLAAVNGPAVGIGVTMTLACDIRIAADDARFGFVFARRGVVPEACSSWFLPRLVGISQALEWTYSGRVFPANEALNGGLVRSLHSKDSLLSEARELALELTQQSAPVSIALIRHMMWQMLGADHPADAHRIDSKAMAFTGGGADAREGIDSFLQKRPAQFKSRVSEDMPDFYPWAPPQTFAE